jgi:glycogen operon protein
VCNNLSRHTTRDLGRGAPATVSAFGSGFTGSSDLYAAATRKPTASVNFVTCHDGFTLVDLVSYNDKHNGANGEANHDGESFNRSWNHGIEGPTDDEAINALRDRQRRNMVTTLLLSQGVPMLLGGDELGRTHAGNNNATCQDNELSWYDWVGADTDFLEWVRRLVAYRSAHPVFRRRRWFQGRRIRGMDDMVWFRHDGEEMTDDDWETGFARSVGVYMNGDTIKSTDLYGERMTDDTFVLVFNASELDLPWVLPDATWGKRWFVDLDTADPASPAREITASGTIQVHSRSLVVLRRVA